MNSDISGLSILAVIADRHAFEGASFILFDFTCLPVRVGDVDFEIETFVHRTWNYFQDAIDRMVEQEQAIEGLYNAR